MTNADDPRNHSADTNNLTNTTRLRTPGPQTDPSDAEEQLTNPSMSTDTDDLEIDRDAIYAGDDEDLVEDDVDDTEWDEEESE